jgi:hypothetical protein
MPVGMGSMLMGMGKGWVEMYKPVPIPMIPSPMNPAGYPYPCQSLLRTGRDWKNRWLMAGVITRHLAIDAAPD